MTRIFCKVGVGSTRREGVETGLWEHAEKQGCFDAPLL